MGRQPLRGGRRIDRPAMYAEAEALFQRLGVDLDPRRPARGLSIADQQIIEIAKAISLDAGLLDHGRADRRPERRRGRPALPGRPEPARRGPRPGVHLAPVRRGVRALRHGHGDARRRVRLHPADPGDHRRPAGLPHGRSRGGRPVPEDAGRARRGGPRGGRARVRRHLPRRQLHGPGRGDRRRSPVWWAPGAARSRGRCSVSTPTTRAACGCRAGRSHRTTPARPSGPAWRSSRRTVASRAWSPRARSLATSPG